MTFDWTHSYGPLDWPRDGTTLLNIRSDRPHYWKVETLDGFDGFRWLRTRGQQPEPRAARPAGTRPPEGRALELLRVQPALGRALPRDRPLALEPARGGGGHHLPTWTAPATSISADDGTTIRADDEPLERGDSYTVRAYAPDPTAGQMRGAPETSSLALAPVHDAGPARPGRERSRRRVALARGGVRPRGGAGAAARQPGGLAPRRVRRRTRAARLALRARLPAGARAHRGRGHHLRRGQGGGEPPPAQLPLQRAAAQPRRAARGVPVRGQDRLLPAVLGSDGADAADVGDPGAGGGRASRPAPTTATRASTACATSTPTRGSRSTSTASAGCRSTRRPTAAPAESQSSGFGATSAARADAGRGALARRGAAASERAAGGDAGARRRRRRRAGLVAARAPRWSAAGAAASAARAACAPAAARASGDMADAQLAELRRALVAARLLAPGRHHAARRSSAASGRTRRPGRGRATRPRCAPTASTRARRTGPGRPSGARCAASSARAAGCAARLRGLLAIPPGGPRPL